MSAPTEESTTGHHPDLDVEQLYRQYHHRLVSHLRGRFPGLPAEDIAHDSVEKLLLKGDDVDPGHAHSLLFKIAGDLALDRLRRNRTHSGAPLHLLCASEPERPDEHVVETTDRELVHSALSALPAADQRLIGLRYWSRMSCQALSEQLNLSNPAVRRQLSRAHRKFAVAFARISAVMVAAVAALREWRRHLATSASGTTYAAVGLTTAITAAVGLGIVLGGDGAGTHGVVISQTSTPARSAEAPSTLSREHAPDQTPALARPAVAQPGAPVAVTREDELPVPAEGDVYVDPDPEDPKARHRIEVDTPIGPVVVEGESEGTGPPTVCRETEACALAKDLLPGSE